MELPVLSGLEGAEKAPLTVWIDGSAWDLDPGGEGMCGQEVSTYSH
jgi:hypothetical protein